MIHLTKNELIMLMADQIIKCYDFNGNTVVDYSNNINLPDLTLKELERLKSLCSKI